MSGFAAAGAPPLAKGRAYTTIDDKLAGAREMKDEGNRLFKDGNFKKAVLAYRKVMAFTRGLPGSKRLGSGRDSQEASFADMISQGQRTAGSSSMFVTDEQEDLALEIESQALTNIATCYLRLEKHQLALESAKKALVLTPTSWKAVQRQAEAQLHLKDFDEAKAAYKRAWELAPETDVKTKNSIASEINGIRDKKRAWEAEVRASTSASFAKAFGASSGAAAPVAEAAAAAAVSAASSKPAAAAASSSSSNGSSSSSSARGSTDAPPTAPAT